MVMQKEEEQEVQVTLRMLENLTWYNNGTHTLG